MSWLILTRRFVIVAKNLILNHCRLVIIYFFPFGSNYVVNRVIFSFYRFLLLTFILYVNKRNFLKFLSICFWIINLPFIWYSFILVARLERRKYFFKPDFVIWLLGHNLICHFFIRILYAGYPYLQSWWTYSVSLVVPIRLLVLRPHTLSRKLLASREDCRDIQINIPLIHRYCYVSDCLCWN